MFESLAAVILLIVFLVPGYVWRIVEGLFVPLERRAVWEIFALELLARSTFIYLPALSFLYLRWQTKWYEQHPWLSSLVAIAFVIVVPTGLGIITGIIRQKRWIPDVINRVGIRAFNPIPSAWDTYFSQARESWVIVTLENGQRVCGYFGQGSHASSDTENRDIYISHVVIPSDGGFQLAENTAGIYVPASEIQTIEFIKQPENAHEQKE